MSPISQGALTQVPKYLIVFLNSQYLFCFVKYQDCSWMCNPMWIGLSIWNEPFHVAPLYNLKKLNHERFP